MAEYEEFKKEKQEKFNHGVPLENQTHLGIHQLRVISGNQFTAGHIGGVDLTFSNSSQNASEEGSGHFMRPGLYHDEQMMKEDEDF